MKSTNNSANTILFVDRAGSQSIWHLISHIRASLERDGYDVHTCRWDDGFGSHEDHFEEGSNDHIITIPPKRRSLGVVNQHIQFAKHFSALLKTLRPDILHTNFVVPGGLATWLGYRAKVPKIITTRHELDSSLSPHLRLWGRFCERYANHITYVSQYVAKDCGHPNAVHELENLQSRARNIVIRNGINISFLETIAPSQKLLGKKAIVVAGRMVPVKGQMNALEGFALAHKIDPSLQLEFIGDGPDKAKLVARVEQLNLRNCVHFHGWLPQERTLAHMKTAHIVLIPSDGTQEGFGLILAEAMALRTSVIANDIPVFKEVSNFGEGVTFTQTNNPNKLSTVLLQKLPKTQISDELDIQQMVINFKKIYNLR